MTVEDQPAERISRAERAGQIIGWFLALPFFILALAVLLGVIAGVFYGLFDAFPTDIPVKEDPGYLDTIFANRFVIWASRVALMISALAIVGLGLFIVASIIVRIRRRQWLRKGGPFEVEEPANIEEGFENVDELIDSLNEAIETNSLLGERLEETSEELERASEEIGRLYDELEAAQRTIAELRRP